MRADDGHRRDPRIKTLSLSTPSCLLPSPHQPPTVPHSNSEAVNSFHPEMDDQLPSALLVSPPLTEAQRPAAVFSSPPLIVLLRRWRGRGRRR
jgi:hypothetical protein